MTGSVTVAMSVVLGALLLAAPPAAHAQSTSPSSDRSLRNGRAPSPAEREFDRGSRAGDVDGWNAGYDAGALCRRYYERVPRLGRQAGDRNGRHFRAGYRASYTRAYRAGYTAARRGDETCWAPGRYR